MPHWLPSIKLKHINTALFAVIILLDGYIVAAPFLPELIARPAAPVVSASASTHHTTTAVVPAPTPKTPQPNQLIIPAMQLDQPIYEGTNTYAELDKGVWRWPASSTPDKGSNTVLLGHRFTYTNPRGVFYFLNLVKVGDPMSVIWNNTTYSYHVSQIEVVTPDHTEIVNPTSEPTLTVYTCTPTWWPEDRLVVIAHLDKAS